MNREKPKAVPTPPNGYAMSPASAYHPVQKHQHKSQSVPTSQTRYMHTSCQGPCICTCVNCLPQHPCFADQDSELLCKSVCMLQLTPVREEPVDCPACWSLHPEPGFEQFESGAVLTEVWVRRESLLPMAMKTLWDPTMLKAFFSRAMLPVGAIERKHTVALCASKFASTAFQLHPCHHAWRLSHHQ